MKVTSLVFTLLLSFGLLAKEGNLTLEPIPLDQVYVPVDSHADEDIRVVISGVLPNLCYEGPEVEFRVVGTDIVIDLLAFNDQYGEEVCAEMIRPVLKVVNVGRLAAGEYLIFAGPSVISRLRVLK